MELLAQGRDCDVFDLGDGTVLRRSRSAYDQSGEARILRYVAEHGYPVPEVHELADEGRDLIMEKVAGPTMVQALERRPWKVASLGRILAELHTGLHEIPAPGWLEALPEGDALCHFDLHPLNVILSPDGPVVIDWTNAVRGRPGHDAARAWLLMACAEADLKGLVGKLVPILRGRLVKAFVDAVGREEALAGLPYAAELTLLDRNISAVERDRLRALVREQTGADVAG
jgi:aminoglycoside phosphotransferase (APT) family kinase protein